ncbi:glutathione S-transferase family protein [Amphritea sp. HPY]|uniref:glutathione S-transferase family protein n=1 Tax=Amphritea sp. HPY TaxID=3421652 RepID=UPI003D7DDBE2
MSYTLYGAPDSANIIIHMVLEQMAVEYDLEWVDRGSKAHRSEQFRRTLNPQGLMPVLLDGDKPVFETAAIALHLADKHQQLAPGLLVVPERAWFLQWLFYLSNTLHADLRVQFYPDRHVSDAAAVEPLLEKTRQRVAGHLSLLDMELAKYSDGPWFLGRQLTILDFYLGVLCRWSVLYPRGKALACSALSSLPNLQRLLSALEQLPAVQRVFLQHKIQAPFITQPTPPELPAEQVSAS